MSEIAELERRITAALERIGRGVDRGFAQAAAAAAPGAVLEGGAGEADADALVAERDAARAEAERLHAAVARLTRQLDAQGLDMQRMRKTVIQLRETLRGLREAQVSGLPDAGLVNAALVVELEALRAERQADLAEMEAIIAELRPLIAEAQDA